MKRVLITGYMVLTTTFLTFAMGDRAMITIHVIEETGEPVSNATVRIGFFDDDGMRVGLSDTNGLFSASGKPPTADVSYSVSKEGYYWYGADYHFSWTYDLKDKCEPWNPTNTVILKQIKNPIPMYVRSVRTGIPIENNPVGFDLEKGDWVSPHGVGVKSDLEFQLNRNVISEDNFDCYLQIAFPNLRDGLQEYIAEPVSPKSLRLPYCVPETGYVNKWERSFSMTPGGGGYQHLTTKKDQNYMFRIRTVLDENGGIKRALYGKIYGDINLYGYITDQVTLVFTYYLNPTLNDRNIEFDPDQNLFGGRDRFAP